MSAKRVAIVPARGGSKGIPLKNIQTLGGRPLICHTLLHAQQTPEIDRVVVSTDDSRIARVCVDWGFEVIERPVELGGDEASSESALEHALVVLRERDDYRPDLVAFLQATSPLRAPRDLSHAIAALEQAQADSLFSACSLHGFVWRDGVKLVPVTYDYRKRPRRQEIGPEWIENGSIYLFKPWVLDQEGCRLGGKIAVYEMAPWSVFQIDEPEDLVLVEQLHQLGLTRVPGAEEQLARVELLVLDFDGVVTDDRVLVDETGREAVFCSRSDGFGIERLRATGVPVLVLSKERNPVVAARCRKLGMECHQGYDEKLPKLMEIVAGRSVRRDHVAFVGNDVNDLECLEWAGVGIAVADARPEAVRCAELVTSRPGGRGAVREICDRILEAKRSSQP